MSDLFEHEQEILNDALRHSAEADCAGCRELAEEYGKLLKQLRRATKLSDRTMHTLNTSKHDLLDKVHYDVLTGIYNRRFLEENFKRTLKSIARSGGVLSVLMIDIDHFKPYNDTYSHYEGDNCLKVVAETIAECLTRADDFAARYGGEEFFAVLPDTDHVGAVIMAERILENIRLKRIPHEKNTAADCVTVSIGLTTSKVLHKHKMEDYIRQSDKALYESKQSGRNKCTYIDFEEE